MGTCFLFQCDSNAGFQSAWSWQASVSLSLRLIQPSTVPSRAFRTMLGSSSLTESMTDALAETLGVEPAEKTERFKVGGVRHTSGHPMSFFLCWILALE